MRVLSTRQRIRIALRLWMPVLVLRIVVVQPLSWGSTHAHAHAVISLNTSGAEALVWYEDDFTDNVTEHRPGNKSAETKKDAFTHWRWRPEAQWRWWWWWGPAGGTLLH